MYCGEYSMYRGFNIVCVCLTLTLQECLEKCGESLQEIVNYHMVRNTSASARGQRWSGPTRPGPLGLFTPLRHPVSPGSSIAQRTHTNTHLHTLTVSAFCYGESVHTGQSRSMSDSKHMLSHTCTATTTCTHTNSFHSEDSTYD